MINVQNVLFQIVQEQFCLDAYPKHTNANILGIISSNKPERIFTYSLSNGFLYPIYRNIHAAFDHSSTVFETIGFIPDLSSIKSLLLLTCIKKISANLDISDALKQQDFDKTIQKYIGIYSFDLCEQIEIAQSIVNEHSFLLLNDPFKGLDDGECSLMLDFIFDYRQLGKIVLLTCESVSKIEDLCEVVCEHKTGKLVRIRSTLI
jgi:ABC-type uncharacterized transport system, ATPase component